MGMDGGIGAMGQARIHLERHVRCGQHFAHRGLNQVWQPLPTILRVTIQGRPATFTQLIEGLFEPLRRAHDAVLQSAAFGITHHVERCEHIARDLAGFFQHRAGEISIQLVIAGHILRRCVQHLVQNELQILGRR